MDNNYKELLSKPSMKLFGLLAGYFLSVLILYTICQFLNFRDCLGLVQALSITIPVIVYLLTLKSKKRVKAISLVLGIYFFLTLLLPFIYGKTFDLTIDGNSYHKTAIAFIKNGWNPIYESSLDFQKENSDKVISFDKDTKINLWIEHYPKATWITAATIYNMTNNIESGKCITLIFSIMLLIITYNCLNIILSRKWASIISVLVVLNPITLAQLFSYYVDSLMGIFFVIEILLLFMINPMKKQNKFIWMSLASVCAFFVNIKYTGLLASGVIAAIFYFYWLIKYHKEKDFLIRFRNITFHFIIVFVTAIFFVGANSYIKNTIDHLNPLYPIIGKDKVDIVTTMQPKSFGKKNMVEKFVISLFSKTENTTYEMEPDLKLPIKVYRSEVSELLAPDVRIGGFGPLFALIFIESLIILIVASIIFIKNEKKNLKYLTIPILAVVISMILLGENWWARYVPQLYLLPIGALILSLYTKKYMKKEIISIVASIILILTMTVNICCFFYVNYIQLKSFVEINQDITEMRNTKNLKLKLGTDKLYGYFYTLNDNNVKYEVVDEIKEENQRFKYSWRVVVEEK